MECLPFSLCYPGPWQPEESLPEGCLPPTPDARLPFGSPLRAWVCSQTHRRVFLGQVPKNIDVKSTTVVLQTVPTSSAEQAWLSARGFI